MWVLIDRLQKLRSEREGIMGIPARWFLGELYKTICNVLNQQLEFWLFCRELCWLPCLFFVTFCILELSSEW